jgi:xanthine dehydrogenase accessory factor
MTHDDTEHGGSGECDPSGPIDDGDVSALEAELRRLGEPYARVTVVRREAPASANVGDRAVVTADGEIYGWVGGVACAQSVIERVGTEAIDEGAPTLVGIAPDPDAVDRPGLEAFPMTCHSDGVLELFVEPVVPDAELVIVGDSAVARSLARLAEELAIGVTLVADADAVSGVPADTELHADLDPDSIVGAVGPAPIVVAASMGEYDSRGIAAGVLADAPYVGLVASDERAGTEIDRAAGLLDRDRAEVAAAVTNPAGVDIEAYTPAEIAASLLAEVVDVRAGRAPAELASAGAGSPSEPETTCGSPPNDDAVPATHSASAPVSETASDPDAGSGSGSDTDPDSEDAPTEAVDPVCGMSVDPAAAAATDEYRGETYYFCCRGCADSFESDPESYLDAEGIDT